MAEIVGIKVAKGEGGSYANGGPNSLSDRRLDSESVSKGSGTESVGGWRSDSARNRICGEAERRKGNWSHGSRERKGWLEKEMKISGLIGVSYWAKMKLMIFFLLGITFWIYGHWPYLWLTLGAISFSFHRWSPHQPTLKPNHEFQHMNWVEIGFNICLHWHKYF